MFLLKRLLKSLEMFRLRMLWATVLMVVCGVLEVFNVGFYLPLMEKIIHVDSGNFFSKTLDFFAADFPDEQKLIFVTLVLFILAVFKFFFRILLNYVLADLMTQIRKHWFDLLFRLKLSSRMSHFFSTTHGIKVNLITNETARATQVVSDFISLIFKIVQSIALCTVVVLTSWKIAFSVFFSFGFFFFLLRGYTRSRLKAFADERLKLDSNITSFLSESLQGVKQIKAFNMLQKTTGELEMMTSNYQSLTMKQEFFEKLPMPIGEMFISLGVFLGILYMWLTQQQASLLLLTPVIGVFVITVKPLLTLISDILSIVIGLSQRIPSVKAILNYLDQIKSQVEDEHNFAGLSDIFSTTLEHQQQGLVQFDHVYFSFEQGKEILSDVSFSIPRKGLVLIQGPSGAGKSTLMDLILGFYDNYKGTIRINGHELRDLNLGSLRSRVGLVSQDVFLFNLSVRENIAFNCDMTDQELKQVCIKADCWDFVTSMSNGLDTRITEGGRNLSGGQRQRLSIARALAHKPEIYIFDEPTSALDGASAKKIWDLVLDLAQNSCVLFITHNLTSVESAKKITKLIVQGDGSVLSS